jgi:hypothetical protein
VIIGGALLTGLDRNQIWWWAYPIAVVVAAATHAAFRPLQSKLRASLSVRVPAVDVEHRPA